MQVCGCINHILLELELELELMAIAYTLRKLDFYVRGNRNLGCFYDNRPLGGILSKNVADIENPCLQRIRMKMTPYTFKGVWCCGAQLKAADALSRTPVSPPSDNDINKCLFVGEEMELEGAIALSPNCKLLLDAVRSDQEYKSLLEAIKNKERLGTEDNVYSHQLKSQRSNISVVGGDEQLAVLDGKRITV